VVIKDSAGIYYMYAHLDSISVRKGDRIKRGQQIGTVGYTAYTKDDPDGDLKNRAPHLHFETADSSYPKHAEARRIDPVEQLNRLSDAPEMGSGGGGSGTALVLVALAGAGLWFYMRPRKPWKRGVAGFGDLSDITAEEALNFSRQGLLNAVRQMRQASGADCHQAFFHLLNAGNFLGMASSASIVLDKLGGHPEVSALENEALQAGEVMNQFLGAFNMACVNSGRRMPTVRTGQFQLPGNGRPRLPGNGG
jgi:hypothetical protein